MTLSLNSTTLNVTDISIYNTTEPIITRPRITPAPIEVWIESCTVSDGNANIILAVVITYGILLSLLLCLKGMRTFHVYNMQFDDYQKMLFCDQCGLFWSDCAKKWKIYLVLALHIWNQATDIGVIVEMYYLSFRECSLVYSCSYSTRKYAIYIYTYLYIYSS